MSRNLMLDLDQLEVETLQTDGDAAVRTLEMITGGHGMTEISGSAVGGCPVFLCSCCCCT